MVVSKVCDALVYLFDNIFIKFGTKLYRQTIGIPMGTIYYSKVAKDDHFFDVRYFVHIITIYNQIATKGKSMFGPHKRVIVIDLTCTFCTRSMGRGLPVKIVD